MLHDSLSDPSILMPYQINHSILFLLCLHFSFGTDKNDSVFETRHFELEFRPIQYTKRETNTIAMPERITDRITKQNWNIQLFLISHTTQRYNSESTLVQTQNWETKKHERIENKSIKSSPKDNQNGSNCFEADIQTNETQNPISNKKFSKNWKLNSGKELMYVPYGHNHTRSPSQHPRTWSIDLRTPRAL